MLKKGVLWSSIYGERRSYGFVWKDEQKRSFEELVMMAKNYLSFVCGVILAILCMGCENPHETETGGEPHGITFIPQFIVENNGSTAQTISLKKVLYLEKYYTEDYYKDSMWDSLWDIVSEAGRVEDSPVNAVVPPSGNVTLKTQVGMRIDIDYTTILSFVLTIDNKHYVGWAANTGTGDLQGIAAYELGYVRIIPGKIDPYNMEPVLMSTLTPKSVEQNEYSGDVTATYRVTITGAGISFALDKQSVIADN
jgi:hypothetical protein